MAKKGFTLIELLAVIVVLAIIALIATPIVMNTIKKSQKGAAERSAENYIDAVETAVATAKLDSDGIPDGIYTINDKGNLEGNGLQEPLTIEMNGNKPKSGTITISNGQVTTDSKMTVGSYEVSYNPTTKKYEATENSGTSSTIVYGWSEDTINIGDTMDDPTQYTTDASTLGRSIYLKYALDKDNKLTELYACATFSNEEYCLRGGNASFYGYAANEADYTGNALILKKLRDAKIEGVSCDFSDSGSRCSNDSVSLRADLDGYVNVSDNDGRCRVYGDGRSSCES